MKISGQTRIAAPRERVWAALMDPDVLARCIDGVESLERTEDDRFAGKMNAKVGPVRAKFTGEVAIQEAEPPQHYVLRGEGKGGVAGFAKGSAAVDLEEPEPGATILNYTAESQVGGKLAQLGSRLVEGAAKGYAERFFENFKDVVEGNPGSGAVPAAAEEAQPLADPVEASPGKPSVPADTPAAQEPTAPVTGAVDDSEPFRSESSGLGVKGWAALVILIAAGIVAIQFL
ncbi:hypothetical protein B5C34_01845 [Pacificimonas flava]|uniref:Carbon monoxide dehydrogenase n=2 Tax=Pacificimonas TaxID=1960290 RepID=A0A219B3C5_9SPHN|nr:MULTISPECIES: carbon monoxide dehydrogenase subunit G [Pacificimonas]MBZ6378039.1 carbon monoxide dehydrogenase subunit G [Pacificimonas aurantium]OWV32318.1 hypothetical protein B5C34_01845 [Pacificimonas flava]